LETAHPSKFKPDVERILQQSIEVPERLSVLANKEKVAMELETDYESFKHQLITKFYQDK
jgi:threonine synthase